MAKERTHHRHGPDALRKDYLASHMREPHPYGFSALNASQLTKWNAEELRREHDRMHFGERCSKCGEPLDSGEHHFPAALGGGCIDTSFEAQERAARDARIVECPFCGHYHAAGEIAICEGRAVVESLGEIPSELR